MHALQPLALHKVIDKETRIIRILQNTSGGWCPLVLQLLVDLPVLLPECNGLLLALDQLVYPDLWELCLATWKLLGDWLQVRHFPLSLLVCTGTKGGDMAKASRMFKIHMP